MISLFDSVFVDERGASMNYSETNYDYWFDDILGTRAGRVDQHKGFRPIGDARPDNEFWMNYVRSVA